MSAEPLWSSDWPASTPQREYIRLLLEQRHVGDAEACQLIGVESLGELTKAEASTLIDLLKPEQKGELNRRLAELRGQLSF